MVDPDVGHSVKLCETPCIMTRPNMMHEGEAPGSMLPGGGKGEIGSSLQDFSSSYTKFPLNRGGAVLVLPEPPSPRHR